MTPPKDQPFLDEMHRMKAIWDRLHSAAAAAVQYSADADAAVLGVADTEAWQGAVNELEAVLGDERGAAVGIFTGQEPGGLLARRTRP